MPDRSPARGLLASALVACFALACLAVPRAAIAQPGNDGPLRLDILGIEDAPAGDKSEAEIRLTPEKVPPGGEVTLSVMVRVPQGSYTYSNNPKVPGATRIDVTKATGLVPLGEGFTANYAPKVEFEPAFDATVEKHTRDVTWTRKYRVAPDASGRVQLAGKLRYQICDASTCLPVTETIDVSAVVAGDAARGPTFEHSERPIVNDQPGPAEVTAALAPVNARVGERVKLAVTLTIDPGWHTYGMWEGDVLGASPTNIEIAALHGLKPVGRVFTPDRAAERKEVTEIPGDIVHEVYRDDVTWTREFEVTAANYGVDGAVTYQVCDKNRCLRPMTVEFALGIVPVPADVEAAPPGGRGARDPRPANGAAEPELGAPGEVSTSADDEAIVPSTSTDTPQALIPFVLAAIGFGFASLLTPCVFPMIPITVSYFLKQSEKEHHKPVTMSLVYCLGIVATFTALGIAMSAIFGVSAMQQAANNAWLNLFFAGVLVFFALNMLGMFEIRVPSWLLNWTSGKESQGGFAGVLFMAFTFTLVSFTCTFAFAGTLLVMAANGEYYWAAVGMLAFSGAFALPFFFLALFPSYLQKLPRGGGWMNRTKVTMGMVELALAFKFLSVADFSLSAATVVLDYAVVMAAWIILSVVTGLYLLGLFRLPHDTPSQHVSVPGFVVALFFLSFGAYLSVGLFSSEKPRGALWAYIEAFAPPQFTSGESGGLGPYLEHEGLEYALDYKRALEFARTQGQPVFLDFTGVNCINCRKMEHMMGNSPLVHSRLKNFVRVQLYTDNVPELRDPAQVESILNNNLRLQEEWLRDGSLPSYAIATPDLKLLARTTGLQSENDFAEFLDDGMSKWQRVVAGDIPGSDTAAQPAVVARTANIE